MYNYSFPISRIPIAKAIGIKLTTTVFTNPGSQIPAERCGFQLDAEVTYEELEQKYGYKFTGNKIHSHKLMSLVIT